MLYKTFLYDGYFNNLNFPITLPMLVGKIINNLINGIKSYLTASKEMIIELVTTYLAILKKTL